MSDISLENLESHNEMRFDMNYIEQISNNYLMI